MGYETDFGWGWFWEARQVMKEKIIIAGAANRGAIRGYQGNEKTE